MSGKTQSNISAKVSVLDRPLRILHLEDDRDDRRVIQQWLKDQNIAADFTDVDTQVDFIKAFEREHFDIILSDKSLPGFDGLSALQYVREKFPHIPFVFVTGSMGEEAAIDTIKHGATDYVLKDRLSRLIPAVQRAIRESEQEEKNRQGEEKIRQQAALLDKAQDAILVTDVEGRVQYWNKGAERVYGWTAQAILGRKITELLPKDAATYQEAKKNVLEKGAWMGELAAVNRGGNELIIEGRWTLMRDEAGAPGSIFIIDTDITEKKALETRLLRTQRMDSIGALAGGIAHDLNNALSPVIMGAELMRDCADEKGRAKFLDIIHSNAQRATSLVKQILNFARGSGGQSGPVKLRQLVDQMSRMIQDTFPKSITLKTNIPGQRLWTIHGDTTEINQVLLNLCVNARDAMPQGGTLTISAENITLDSAGAGAANATPGKYVAIAVADTGTGIPPAVLPRIFEPFFTTKGGDKGTGLGLATIAGIVRRHKGFIDLKTEAGKGTEFKIHLPAIEAAESEAAQPRETGLPTGHGELILVIDDEESVRELTKTTLESYGYCVEAVQNGVQGIARFKEHQREIKLLITDADMPEMDGMSTIRAIKEMRPDLPIILVSGSKRDSAELKAPAGAAALKDLEKPYSLEQLLLAVSTAMGK